MTTANDLPQNNLATVFSTLEQHCTNPVRGACKACSTRSQCQAALTPLMHRLFSGVRDIADDERERVRRQGTPAAHAPGSLSMSSTQKTVNNLSSVLMDCEHALPFQTISDALRYAEPLRSSGHFTRPL